MSRIFISYRRENASGHAGRLYDRLVTRFGRDSVYMDVDMSIPLGTDFMAYIRSAVNRCEVMLVVIDLASDNAGRQRLDNPANFVRMEVAMALGRDIPVIPILTQNTSMPHADELPSDLEPLAYRQGLELSDSRFDFDVGRLIEALAANLNAESSAAEPTPKNVPASSDIVQAVDEAFAMQREAPLSEVPETFTNDIGMTFVRIAAGRFLMGSPDSDSRAHSHEKPQHQVTISQPFYLGIHPVTQAQWQKVMGDNPSAFKGNPTCPVENVSWDDVQRFLVRLSALGDNHIYALPSEAQWEYACRAGSSGIYSFGGDSSQLGDYAWYRCNSKHMTHPVGQKQPNAWGLYDMHGNVWEWCHDGKRRYKANTVTDPSGPTASAYRVIRGGSWALDAWDARAAVRLWHRPGLGLVHLGFRCLSSDPAQASRSR